MKTICFVLAATTCLLSHATALRAQVPQLINYQGRVTVNGVNFDGTGQFKFAFVNATGSSTYWSNDGTSVAGSQPSGAVALTVNAGLYTVVLGDVSLTNMTTVPFAVFNNPDVRLRVWFNDGTNGSQLLAPDQRIAAVGYAMLARNVPDGAITGAKIAAGAVGTNQLASNAVQSGNIALGAIGTAQLGQQVVQNGNIANGAVASAQLQPYITLNGSLKSPVVETGNLTLSSIFGATDPVLMMGGTPFLHNHGSDNTFVGVLSGNFFTGGFGNTGFGKQTLGSLTFGIGNTATGTRALSQNTTGSLNTASGYQTLLQNTTGAGNSAIGYQALQTNTDGGNNTGIGALVLMANTNGSGNTAAGYGALERNTTGNNNTASGFGALNYNSTGSGNTAYGQRSLYFNMTGDANTAYGIEALRSNSSGASNVAAGASAMLGNTTGSNNTATGVSALQTNSTGNYNTAVGSLVLYSNDTGHFNTASGYLALYSNTTGQSNTASGFMSLSANQAGNGNTAFGVEALHYLQTGSGNIGIGAQAGVNNSNGNFNIYLGSPGVSDEFTTMRLGDNQTRTFIAGIFGATSTGGSAVYINSSGQLGTLTSSRRFKQDIRDIGSSSNVLFSLHPVAFRYKPEYDSNGLPQYGLIAEEVEKISPDLVVRDARNGVYSVRYEAVNAMLLNEFLKQHHRLEEQKQQIEVLAARLEELSKQCGR